MAKKWRNKDTNEIYWGDEFGNPLTSSAKSESTYQKRADPFREADPESSGLIKNQTAADTITDYVRNYGGKYIPQLMTVIGGLVGGRGGPWMGARGAGLGSTGGKFLQSTYPQIFGAYQPESLSDIPLDIGTDIAADLVFSGAAKGIGATANALRPTNLKSTLDKTVAKVFKPSPRIPKGAYQGAPLPSEFPALNLTTGQTNRTGNFLENVFNPTEKELRVAGQESDIADWFGRQQYNPESLIERSKINAKYEVASMKNTRQALYDDFRQHATNPKNAKTVDMILPVRSKGQYGWTAPAPVVRKTTIEGAIPLVRSKQFAEDLGQQIQNELGPDDVNLSNLGPGVGNNLKKILTELDKIRNVRAGTDPTSTMNSGMAPMMEFYKLKSLKDQLNQFLRSSADQPMKDRLRGSLTTLASTINADIDAGVKQWGNTAYDSYRKAQDFHANMVKRLRPKIAKDLLKAGDAETTYLDIANEAISDPQRMREFLNITKDKATAKQLFMQAMSGGSKNAAMDIFEPEKALQYLEDNKLVAREVLTPQYRTNVKRFLQQANQVKPLDWQSFANSLTMGQGRAVLQGGAANAAKIILSPLGTRKFVQKVLMNPRYTQIATGALQARPGSPQGKLASRTLMGLAKAAQIEALTEESEDQPTPE